MKKVIAILSLLCMLQLTACAQWYLFPGKNKRTTPSVEKKEEPKRESSSPQESAAAPSDSAATEEKAEEDDFFFGIPSSTGVSLILPVNAGPDKSAAGFMEMYSGALLALRDLGLGGTKINLRFVDSATEDLQDESIYRESDVIIGPVTYSEISEALRFCGRKMLVSPLEPKSAALAQQGENVIQAPTPWTYQVDEIVSWLQSELEFGDEVIVFKENSQPGEQATYLLDRIRERGILTRSVTTAEELGEPQLKGKFRVLIASDNESFISESIKQLGIAATIKGNIVLYTTSRVRNCVSPDVLDLYNTEARLTASYFIDYDSQQVKDFVLAYRALFGYEPGSFAFQGYDTMTYFVKMCSEYGRRWWRRLPEKSWRGLQSDFRFDRSEADGRVNTAVRKVIYGKDLSMTLAQ